MSAIADNGTQDDGDIDALLVRANTSTKAANDALDEAMAFVRESNKRIELMADGCHGQSGDLAVPKPLSGCSQ